MRLLSKPLVKLMAGLLALALSDALFASPLLAACGDYVQSGTEHNVLHRSGRASDPTIPSSRVPCSGPHCSAHDDVPLPVPVPVVEPDDRGILPEPTQTPSGEQACWFRLVATELPARLPTSIFHPPRLARS